MKKILSIFLALVPIISFAQADVVSESIQKDSIISCKYVENIGTVTIVHTSQYDASTTFKYLRKYLAKEPAEKNVHVTLVDSTDYQIDATMQNRYYRKLKVFQYEESHNGQMYFNISIICKDNRFKVVFDNFTYKYLCRTKYGESREDKPHLFERNVDDKESYDAQHVQACKWAVESMIRFINQQMKLEDF